MNTAEVTAYTVTLDGIVPAERTILECSVCGPIGVIFGAGAATRIASTRHVMEEHL